MNYLIDQSCASTAVIPSYFFHKYNPFYKLNIWFFLRLLLFGVEFMLNLLAKVRSSVQKCFYYFCKNT